MTEAFNPYSAPVENVTELSSKSSGSASGGFSIVAPLEKSAGWIKLIGVMFIISGCISILSIWGIIFVWVPIWMGALLVKCSNLIRKGVLENDDAICEEAVDKLRLFFKIAGIVTVIYLSLFLLGIIAALVIPGLLAVQS